MPLTTKPQALYGMLAALMYPQRYNRIFDNPDSDGQYATRDEIARAVIDWSDIDEQRYEPTSPTGAGGGGEDYRYDGLRDGYKAHNHHYDTLEELQLVRGVADDWWGSFSEMLTVYGRCRVNLQAVKQEHWPILSAIMRVAAKNQQHPVLADETALAALAQQIKGGSQMMGGIASISSFASAAQNNGVTPEMQKLLQQQGGPPPATNPQGQGLPLDEARLKMVAMTGPRRVYRIDSTGRISRAGDKKIEVHIRAVFDSKMINQNRTGDRAEPVGKWVYWRID
jgi:hypothetical protein